MPPFRSAVDIYRLLPRTNCRECGHPTCIAFAAAVQRGEQKLSACKYADQQAAADPTLPVDDFRAGIVEGLRARVKGLDLASSAERVGARFTDGRLVVRVLDRDFSVDADGNVSSECHTHSFLVIPLLSYVAHSNGTVPAGTWTPFRELPGASQRGPLFQRRAEEGLGKLADRHPDLFADIITLFGGERSARVFNADVSVILYPLPKVPVLFCYWRPESDLGSTLQIFFDTTATDHLPVESVFELGTGMVMMFEKIAQKHGF